MADPAKRLLRIAHDNCQRLARIINDILDIGKIEAGQIATDPRQVSVAALIDQIIEANQSFADQYGISVRFERADLRAMVYAAPHRLGQVISNLLSNAIKFSPPGAEVVFNTEKAGDSWCITVRDHGVGIPNEYKERIFDRFVQVDATDARKKGGTGLAVLCQADCHSAQRQHQSRGRAGWGIDFPRDVAGAQRWSPKLAPV
jgi:signal transduction histidine kinase